MADVDVGKLLVELRGDFSQLKNDVRQMEQTFQGGFKTVQSQATSFSSQFRSTLKTAFTGLGVALLARDFFQTAVAMDRAQLQLRAIIGNTQEADRTFRQIRDFAVELPLTTNDVVQAFVLLQAVGVKSAQEVTKALSGVAIAMGRDVFNVAQALVGVETEVLRRLGVTVDRTGRQAIVASGNIRRVVENDTESIRDALLEVWREKFPNAIEQSAGFFVTKLNVLKSSWQEFEDAVARTGIIDVLSSATDAATELLNVLRQDVDEIKRLNEEAAKKEGFGIGDAIKGATAGIITLTQGLFLSIKLLGNSIAAISAYSAAVGQQINKGAKRDAAELQGIWEALFNDLVNESDKTRRQLAQLWGISIAPKKLTFWEEFSKDIEEADAATGKLMGTIAGVGNAQLSQRQTKTLQAFAESLRKQAAQLRVNIEEMEKGAKAGRALSLSLAFAEVKKGLPKDAIIPPDLKKEIEENIAAILRLGDALDIGKEKEKDFADEADRIVERQNELREATASYADLTRSLVKEGLGPIQSQLADIDERFSDYRKRLEEAKDAGVITSAQLADMTEKLKNLKDIVTGFSLAESLNLTGSDIEDLDFGEIARKAQESLGNIDQAVAAYNDAMELAAKQTVLFEGSFDSLDDQISATERLIDSLLANGMDPLSDYIRNLRFELADMKAKKDLREAFHSITDAIATGIEDTRRGILEGTQTLSEGMKNLFRNVLIAIDEAVFKEFTIKPLVGVINAFFDGFISEFTKAGNNAANQIAKNLGESLGRALREALDSLTGASGGGSMSFGSPIFSGAGGGGGGINFSQIVTGIGDFFSSAFSFLFGKQGGSVPGGLKKRVPHFATGGEVPAILHEGEYVVQRSAVQKYGKSFLDTVNSARLPAMRSGGTISPALYSVPSYQIGGQVAQLRRASGRTGAPVLSVDFQNAQIIPRAPWTTKEDVFKLNLKMADDRGGDFVNTLSRSQRIG